MYNYHWAKTFQRRCKARLDKKFLIYRGRCELIRDHEGKHALERGLEIVEFDTEYEVKLTLAAEMFVEQAIRKRTENG